MGIINLKKFNKEIKRYFILLGFTFVLILLIILIASIVQKENIFKDFFDIFIVPCYLLQLLAVMSIPYAVFCIYLFLKYFIKKLIKSKKFRISVILLVMFLPITFLYLFYLPYYSKLKPFDLFLNDLLEEIVGYNYPKSNSRISVKSQINGNCIEGEYQKEYIPDHNAVFSFYVHDILVKGNNLNFIVKNYTNYDYNFILEQQKGKKWDKVNIKIQQGEMLPDTAKFDAFQFKKIKSSIRTYREPDCVLFGKVWSTREVTASRSEQVWSHDYYFSGIKQEFTFETKDLDIGRYRVRAEFANTDTLFDEFDIVKKRNVEWIFSEKNFSNPNIIKIGIKNLDKSSFFYSVFDSHSALGAIGYKIKNGKILSKNILLEGYVDFTVPEAVVRGNETVYLSQRNPLSALSYKVNGEWIHSTYKYEREKFIDDFKKYWGDSLSVSLFLDTRSLNWSKYKYQTVESHKIKLSTERIISLWQSNE